MTWTRSILRAALAAFGITGGTVAYEWVTHPDDCSNYCDACSFLNRFDDSEEERPYRLESATLDARGWDVGINIGDEPAEAFIGYPGRQGDSLILNRFTIMGADTAIKCRGVSPIISNIEIIR